MTRLPGILQLLQKRYSTCEQYCVHQKVILDVHTWCSINLDNLATPVIGDMEKTAERSCIIYRANNHAFNTQKDLFLYYLTSVLSNHLLKTALNVLFSCYPSGDKNYFNTFSLIYTHWQIPMTAYEDRIWKTTHGLHKKLKLFLLSPQTLFLEPNTVQAHASFV